MAHKAETNFPRGLARRIMSRAKRGVPLVVTVDSKGQPTRVYDYDEYQKMKELPAAVKPWEHRKRKSSTPDPLGSVEGTVRGSLSRGDIYE